MIVVVGGGTMGGGIAVSFALAGKRVRVVEHTPELAEAADARIRASLERAAGKRDRADDFDEINALLNIDTEHPDPAEVELLIEALPEDQALKRSVLASIDARYQSNENVLIASNTSSLPITDLATVVSAPERFCGMHFFNPVPASQLVEVVVGGMTSDETTDRAAGYGELLGLTPIVVSDSPGFASSRLGVALGLEAIRMVEAGVASAADIDAAMTLGYKHPIGPLRLTDLVGVDVRLAIAQHLAAELGERFAPPQLMIDMARDGKLGKKTGEGFYVW